VLAATLKQNHLTGIRQPDRLCSPIPGWYQDSRSRFVGNPVEGLRFFPRRPAASLRGRRIPLQGL